MDYKKIGKRILFPHGGVIAALIPAAAALLVWSFIREDTASPVSIASYALSFYALVVLCLRVPEIIRWVQRFRRENPYYLRYTADVRLRMSVSLLRACLFNAAYAVFQLCLGIKHASVWFYAMAGYYLILGLMRLMLINHVRKYRPGQNMAREWRKYRLCGACLLTVNFALAIFILYFVFRIREFRHHEITTIAMAAYTFLSFTIAVTNVIRYRKYASPVYSAAKAVSLVSASVSMLTLENALLTAFGQNNPVMFHRIMLGLSGAAVIALVQGIAVYMILRARGKCR